jgi:hypothetical protein
LLGGNELNFNGVAIDYHRKLFFAKPSQSWFQPMSSINQCNGLSNKLSEINQTYGLAAKPSDVSQTYGLATKLSEINQTNSNIAATQTRTAQNRPKRSLNKINTESKPNSSDSDIGSNDNQRRNNSYELNSINLANMISNNNSRYSNVLITGLKLGETASRRHEPNQTAFKRRKRYRKTRKMKRLHSTTEQNSSVNWEQSSSVAPNAQITVNQSHSHIILQMPDSNGDCYAAPDNHNQKLTRPQTVQLHWSEEDSDSDTPQLSSFYIPYDSDFETRLLSSLKEGRRTTKPSKIPIRIPVKLKSKSKNSESASESIKSENHTTSYAPSPVSINQQKTATSINPTAEMPSSDTVVPCMRSDKILTPQQLRQSTLHR